MILFSDPADVAAQGTDPEDVYPNTFWLPPTGMQRGSLLMTDGDPSTPNYPSIEGVYKTDIEELKRTILPKIPCQPIGYGDAKKIFELMKGVEAPEEWRGKIEGIKYTIGGSFTPDCRNCRMTIKTNNKLERKMSSNVIGILKGEVEPDRYVIVGNHRDAWGFGAVDPSSGTAQMTEVIRVLGQKVRDEKWRPRRTIVFASWAAEEYSLTGSREFVEDFVAKLSDRAVVYINVDVCSGGGDILSASATPTIQHKVIEATKTIPSIRDPSQTYYEFWQNWTQAFDNNVLEPEVYLPGAGSDHASFIFFAGVPVIDTSFDPDLIEYPALADNGYPGYHTAYETLYLVESLIDPEVKVRETCSKLNLRLIRDFSDRKFLDFKPEAYADLMTTTLASFAFSGTLDIMNSLNVSISSLRESIKAYGEEVKVWRTRLDTLDIEGNPLVARYVNDQMMKIDRVFLLPQGLPETLIYRHAIISPSKYDTYSAGSFPGLTDLVNGIDSLTKDEVEIRVLKLRKHVSDLTVVIHQAADFLKDVSVF